MRIRTEVWIAVAALLASAGGPAAAQSLAERMARAPDGVVRFAFASDPWVCGDGAAITVRDPEREGKDAVSVLRGSFRRGADRAGRCVSGPVRVRLEVRSGRVEDVAVRVGEVDPGEGGTDLGEVPAGEGAALLLDVAARVPADAGEEAVLGAVLARGVTVHPELARLAASDAVPVKTRRTAVFWMGQEGAPLEALQRVYAGAPDAVREQVLFAYSQRREPEAARELLRLARSSREPRGLREKAVFWLGQVAGRAVTGDLDEIADDEALDVEVRERAVFALSQRPRDEGVPALIRIARTSPDPRLRKKAIFWLGQSGDPGALLLFQEILGIR